jgi:ribosomal protein S18 acetylase RimI-like enzyme
MTEILRLSEADEEALDHPIWSALAGVQKELALGDRLARRYPASISPLAAMSEATPKAFESLTVLIERDGPVALFTVEKTTPPPNLETQLESTGYQMIATAGEMLVPEGAEPIRLGAIDVPDMLRLVELTKPGPFCPRTHELGDYIGIRDDGKLIAMAGERMRFQGYVEISAVCVHPEHRGKGYARILMTKLMRKLIRSGTVPILHVFADNSSAIALYQQLGFVTRKRLHVTVLSNRASGDRAEDMR